MPNYNAFQHIFLIAMPHLEDPFFGQSIVYLWEYNEEGAKGVIVNKLMKPHLGDLLRHLAIPVQNERAREHPMLAGGPVSSERGFLVQRKHDINFDTGKAEIRITVGSAKEDLLPLANGKGLDDTLVFLGCATWEAGQLDKELKNNDWLIAPFSEATLFSALSSEKIADEFDSACTWRDAVANIGINLSNLSLEAGHA